MDSHLVGLLVGLGVVGMLMFQQNKPAETSETPLPTENIEKANEAAEVVEQRAEQLQQDLQKLP
ncbi:MULTISPECIES: hypothetical protein [Cyanophyceae]|uniref:hypothetical protein n=1 Tax=Cyanophyceae TaxID=3028117 RepID=UPI0016844F22|nr:MULTISPECIES: hypothetical protein [Cyanophyceae]MBD1919250.1 hypothetical protein [Phormidium sp. FACHB-77]MBD2030956.1 hypothetical protein [Phormidium sp. FACHB-322]MBD2054273.1 hypothetical protein [Leptolyngbya sp. FACHB-60]